jgi:hypothetical protein
LLPGAPVTGKKPAAIVAGDFNADGKLDFAVTNQSDDTTTVMLGAGTGTVFTAASASPFRTGAGTTSPVAVVAADFNGDGTADLAVVNSNKNNVGILLNQLTDTSSVLITGISIPGNGSNSKHVVEASYAGDANFAASSETLQLKSTQITTSTLLSASTTTPNFGQQVVLTATLQPSLVGALTPTGTVVFKDGTATIGTTNVSGGVATLTLNTTGLAAGTHSITAKYSSDANFLTSTSPALGVIVGKTMPAITWATPSPISYGTLLASAQLNATTTVSGTFAYNPSALTSLTAGTYTLNVTFTPADSTDYTIATASVTLVVNPATPQISWPTPAPISFGTALSGIQLDATVSVYNAVPLSSFYNVSGIYPDGTSFGSGGFDADGNAYSSNLLGTSITWNNITYQLGPVGAPDAISNTSISLPPGHYAGLNMLGALVNNATAANTFVVTYTDGTTASVTQSLSDWVFPLNYAGESEIRAVQRNLIAIDAGQVSILAAAGGIAVRDAGDSASAANGDTFTFTESTTATTTSPVGNYPIVPVVAGANLSDYTVVYQDGILTIGQATPVITWAAPARIIYGTALGTAQLNATASVTGGLLPQVQSLQRVPIDSRSPSPQRISPTTPPSPRQYS